MDNTNIFLIRRNESSLDLGDKVRGNSMTETNENSESLLPRSVIAVSDFEILNGVLKFFNVKGLIRKKIVAVRSIPVNEISSVESYRNELSITWNGFTNIFFKKNSFESFTELRDKLRGMIKEYKITLEKNAKPGQRKNELTATIKAIVPVVDTCFDILMSLNQKIPNWKHIAQFCSNLGQNLSINNQFLPSLALDFSRIPLEVELQSAQNVANEVRTFLKFIHEYFAALNVKDDLADMHRNLQDTVTLVSSYYALNDIFFGKVVGEKDNKTENLYLEDSLLYLSESTNFKVNVEEIKVSINRFDVEDDKDTVVGDTREIFKAQLSQL